MRDPYFIMDQYWFAIVGQFGFLGLAVVVLLIAKYYKFIWRKAKGNIPLQMAAVVLIFTSLFASVAAATYIQSSILASTYSILSLSGGSLYGIETGKKYLE